MGFDLSTVDTTALAENGYTFQLDGPNGMPLDGAFVTIRGKDSTKVKNYWKKVYKDMQRKNAIAKKRGRDPDEMDLEEAEDMAVESAIVRTLGWEGLMEGKKELKFPEDADYVFRKYEFIRKQVIDESEDLGNFMKMT